MDLAKIFQNYVITILHDDNSHQIYRILEKREKDFKYRFESSTESLAYARNTKFLILNSKDTPVYKNFRSCIFNTRFVIEDFLTILPLIEFLNEFIASDQNEVTIIIGENDIDDFRLACFISSYIETKEKRVLIIDTSFTIIPKLYVPTIQKASLAVLFSIVKYSMNFGEYPDIKKLREYHFSIIKSDEIEQYNIYSISSNNTNLSNNRSSYRNWKDNEDSKFVQAIYASQRMLERLGLLTKRKNDIDGTIVEIIPTLNGILTVIFSDMSNIFTNTKQIL